MTQWILLGSLTAWQALDVGGDYAAQLDRWLTARAEAHWDRRDATVRSVKTKEQAQARTREVRARLLREIGGLPAPDTPLNARVTGGFQRDGYRVEHVIFESQPGFRVTANLYLPSPANGRVPAVLGVAGHSANGKASATYQHAWIGFVKRGIAVLAYDPPGQGERSEYLDPATGKSRTGIGVPEHIMAGVQALLTGHTLARYFIHDGIRAFDYLLTRPEIDPARIAVAGNSGGGTQAAYLAAFEPRLAAVVSSCYMTSWRELWRGPGPQDAEQVFPGFLRDELDFGDFPYAAGFKPFLMTTAIRDFFPIAGARATYQEAVRTYEAAGVSERAGYFEYDDTHGWSRPRREAAYRWLDKWFFGRTTEGQEGDIETEPESALYATPTGHLATSPGGSATVQQLNAAHARTLRRTAPDREALRRILNLGPTPATPPAARGAVERDGFTIQKLEFEAAGGVRFPALFVDVQARRSILAVSGGAEWLAFARLGYNVLKVDPRGWGEGAARKAGGGYSAAYQTAARTWLLGEHLAGYQVADVLQAAAWLRARGEVRLFGEGTAAPIALLAAALDEGIARVALERSILSYQQFVEAPVHEGLTNLVVPGILRETDLPELRALLGSRPLWLVSPVTPTGAPVLATDARRVYPWAAKVMERPEGWPLAKVYAGWL